MSNRRQPRRVEFHEFRPCADVSAAIAAAWTARCPDCHSERSAPLLLGRLVRVELRHDDTCPWWRAHTREAAS